MGVQDRVSPPPQPRKEPTSLKKGKMIKFSKEGRMTPRHDGSSILVDRVCPPPPPRKKRVQNEKMMKDAGDLTDIWNEMAVGMDCIKVPVADSSTAKIDKTVTTERERECDHSFTFKDDIGTVCRVCGLIEKEIQSIIQYQFGKSFFRS